MRQERRSSASKPALILSFRRVLQYGLPGVDAWPNESIGLPQRHPLSNYPMHQPDSSFPPYSATIQPIGGFTEFGRTSTLALPPSSATFLDCRLHGHSSFTNCGAFCVCYEQVQRCLVRRVSNFATCSSAMRLGVSRWRPEP